MGLESYKSIMVNKILDNIGIIAEALADNVIDRFVEFIGDEDADTQLADPSHPFHYLEEFREFLISEVSDVSKHSLTTFGMVMYTGDGPRLGFDERLDAAETDAIKIIGTVIQGISGNYVLVLPEQAQIMFGDKFQQDLMGRFGGAFIMPVDEYTEGINKYGWPDADIWEFSNFPGIPDLFDNVKLEEHIGKTISEVLAT